jgi:5'-3' exonuclease
MGVPSFYRWLVQQWPRCAIDCRGDEQVVINGAHTPTDTSAPNPNGIEFDNLYFDLNGIIHPCSAPNEMGDSPTEEEIFLAMFDYIERIFSMVRPRKVVYLAIDGVAPKAKMNQQRTRRFRTVRDTIEHDELDKNVKDIFTAARLPHLIPPTSKKEKFDKNTITPGTPFMSRLSDALRYFIAIKLNNDPGWKNLAVIFSDATVPGEGEHKVISFVRNQRSLPGYDPNTVHCLYGMDADLIMLGLASHERRFYIVREIIHARNEMICALCKRAGHHAGECKGLQTVVKGHSANLNNYLSQDLIKKIKKEAKGRTDELNITLNQSELEPFQFLSLEILRSYLGEELKFDSQLFDIENAIDDWVFLCFFVGNDFLPHLSAFSIKSNAIGVMQKLWKSIMLSKITNFEKFFVSKYYQQDDQMTLLPEYRNKNLPFSEIKSTFLTKQISFAEKKNIMGQIYITSNGEVNLPQLHDLIQKLSSIETAIFSAQRERSIFQVKQAGLDKIKQAKDLARQFLENAEIQQKLELEAQKTTFLNFNLKKPIIGGDNNDSQNQTQNQYLNFNKRKEPENGFDQVDSNSDQSQTLPLDPLNSLNKRHRVNTLVPPQTSTMSEAQMKHDYLLAKAQLNTLLSSIPESTLKLSEALILERINNNNNNQRTGNDSKTDHTIPPYDTNSDDTISIHIEGNTEMKSLSNKPTVWEKFQTKVIKNKLIDDELIKKALHQNPYIAWRTARNVLLERLETVPLSVDQIDYGSKGYVERFYKTNFQLHFPQPRIDSTESSPNLSDFPVDLQQDINHIHLSYLTGLRWVFHYYYKGCSSWSWHYPFHHPPLLTELAKLPLELYSLDQSSPMNHTASSHQITLTSTQNGQKTTTTHPPLSSHHYVTTSLYSNSKPVLPFEQLLSVFPAQSSHALPKPYAKLMTDPDSPIIDFYPSQFNIDTHGVRFMRSATTLLPFIDASRLKRATRSLNERLSLDELQRNTPGENVVFFNMTNTVGAKGEIREKNVEEIRVVFQDLSSRVDKMVKEQGDLDGIDAKFSFGEGNCVAISQLGAVVRGILGDGEDGGKFVKKGKKDAKKNNRHKNKCEEFDLTDPNLSLELFSSLIELFVSNLPPNSIPPTKNIDPNNFSTLKNNKNNKNNQIFDSFPEFRYTHDTSFFNPNSIRQYVENTPIIMPLLSQLFNCFPSVQTILMSLINKNIALRSDFIDPNSQNSEFTSKHPSFYYSIQCMVGPMVHPYIPAKTLITPKFNLNNISSFNPPTNSLPPSNLLSPIPQPPQTLFEKLPTFTNQNVVSFCFRLSPSNPFHTTSDSTPSIPEQITPTNTTNPLFSTQLTEIERQLLGSQKLKLRFSHHYTFEYLLWVLCGGDIKRDVGLDSMGLHVIPFNIIASSRDGSIINNNSVDLNLLGMADDGGSGLKNKLFGLFHHENSKDDKDDDKNDERNCNSIRHHYTLPNTSSNIRSLTDYTHPGGIKPNGDIIKTEKTPLTAFQNLTPFLNPILAQEAYSPLPHVPLLDLFRTNNAVNCDFE